METGYLSPDGKTSLSTRSLRTAFVVNQKIDLVKRQYILDKEVFDMKDITFMEKAWGVSVDSPWRGLGSKTEFDYTHGRLYETKNSIIFVGEIPQYGIYGSGGGGEWDMDSLPRAQQAYQLRRKNYLAYFILNKSEIKGYRRLKKSIEIYCISNGKKITVDINPQTKNYDINRFTFLMNYPETRSLKELDRVFFTRKSDRDRAVSLLEWIVVVPIMTGFFGLSFLYMAERTEHVVVGVILVLITILFGIWMAIIYMNRIRN